MIESLSLQNQPLTFKSLARDLLSIQKLINGGIIKQEEMRMTQQQSTMDSIFTSTKKRTVDGFPDSTGKNLRNYLIHPLQRYNRIYRKIYEFI